MTDPIDVDALESRVVHIRLQSYGFHDKYVELLAVAMDALAALRQQQDLQRMLDSFMQDNSEMEVEITRLRAAIEEALEDLNGYGDRGFTDCFRILRKALKNKE